MIRFTYTRPSTEVSWAHNAITSASADVVNSFNTYENHMATGAPTSGTRSERVEANDTTLHVFYSFNDIPETDPENVKQWGLHRLQQLATSELSEENVLVGGVNVGKNRSAEWVYKYRKDNNIQLSAVDIVDHTFS